jgi:hypothetical protein
MLSFLKRLKQRKIVQWAIGYFAVAWAMLEVFDMIAEQFLWPVWIRQTSTVLVLTGGLVTIVLAWYHGERGRQKVGVVELGIVVTILALEHQVFYDANLQMYGGINLRNELGSVMSWTDEEIYFTPYARGLLEKHGPPPPESGEAEFEQRMLELRKFHEDGGGNLLALGTDEPVYTTLLPGFAFHRELLAMVHAGLPNTVVLKAATINGAQALGVADRLGSIEVGKLADLYVARGNPLEDIKAARNVQFVMKSGVVYDPQSLLKSAKGKIGPTGPDNHAEWELRIKPLRKQ